MRRAWHLAWLGLLPSCTAPGPETCTPLQYADMKVDFALRGLPSIRVEIGGKMLNMLVDTGANASALTPQAARAAAAAHVDGAAVTAEGVNGPVAAEMVSVPAFQLGGVTIQNEPFLVAPSPRASGISQIGADGLIGEDILQNFNLDLDFPRNRFALYRLDACAGAWQGQFAVQSFKPSQAGAPLVAFTIDNGNFTGAVDTGADSTAVNQAALAREKVQPLESSGGGRSVGLGGLARAESFARFSSIGIGIETFDDTWLAVSQGENYGGADALIGENYLRVHRVFINNAAGRIYLGAAAP